MRDTAGSTTALAARCRNFRRGSFMARPPLRPLRKDSNSSKRRQTGAVRYFDPANARSGSKTVEPTSAKFGLMSAVAVEATANSQFDHPGRDEASYVKLSRC